MIKKIIKNSERGQAIILIALAIIGMIGMVGLMTDGGILLVEYARLKRGIDAASIAAALQFRKNFVTADLEAAAEELLRLNQSDVDNVQVVTCITLPTLITDPDEYAELEPQLCTEPKRKLVYVKATRVVTFGFMRALGFNSTTISASAIGEAASVDLVLVMDTSASMAFETLEGGNDEQSEPGEDPAECNLSHTCQPMEDIKADALAFIETMYFPYDRVGIVTMTSQNPDGFRDSEVKLFLDDNYTTDVNGNGVYDYSIENAINDITVHEPSDCPNEWGSCRELCDIAEIHWDNGDRNADGDYTDPDDDPPPAPGPDDDLRDWPPCYNKPVGYYLTLGCNVYFDPDILNPTSCGSSNVGGALHAAQEEFAREPNREESFWVVIALVGGPANATDPPKTSLPRYNTEPRDAFNYPADEFAFGFCPKETWNDFGDRNGDGFVADPPQSPPDAQKIDQNPLCRGADVSEATRHKSTEFYTDPLYDADDYARDAADTLAGEDSGITIFTIGLGHLIRESTKGDPLAGEKLLQYIALEAGDDPGQYQASHGEYHYVEDPGGPELQEIFDAIAENIFTRISK